MARVLLTGASGLIGRALQPALRAAGHELRVVSRQPMPPSADDPVDWLRGDLLDPRTREAALDGIDIVVHGAALVDHHASAADLRRVNVELPLALREASRAAGVRRFVHLSSVAAEPGGGSTAYGRSKIEAEAALRAQHDAPPLWLLRPAPVYSSDRERLRRLLHWVRRLRLAAHLVPDTRVHLASRENVVQGVLAALTRGEPGRPYVLADAGPVGRGELSRIVADAAGAADLALPTSVVVPALRAAIALLRAAGRMTGRPPALDDGVLRMLLRERAYDIGTTRRDLGLFPESTAVGFSRTIRACLEHGR